MTGSPCDVAVGTAQLGRRGYGFVGPLGPVTRSIDIWGGCSHALSRLGTDRAGRTIILNVPSLAVRGPGLMLGLVTVRLTSRHAEPMSGVWECSRRAGSSGSCGPPRAAYAWTSLIQSACAA